MKLENENLIKKWEGLKLEAYLPTENDKWTIGWGHTSNVYKGMSISVDQAEDFFDKDTAWANKAVNDFVKVPLSQNQFDSLVSLVFNIGATNFKNSTLLRKLNAKDYQGAAGEFLVWNKQTNKRTGKKEVLQGLVNRRQEEYEYFIRSDVIPGPSSATVTPPDPQKSLGLSKELLGGAATVLTGAGTFMGQLGERSQDTLSMTLSVVLLAVGAFFIWTRIQDRKKGLK